MYYYHDRTVTSVYLVQCMPPAYHPNHVNESLAARLRYDIIYAIKNQSPSLINVITK